MARRICLSIVAFLLWSAPAQAAITVVQSQTGRANDLAVTFGGAWSASNHVFVVGIMNDSAQTVDLTGITPTETILHDEAFVTEGLRAYSWCFAGDGSDTSFTATTSGGASVVIVAVELAGGSCTEDGTSSASATTATTTHGLATDLSTSVDGSFILGVVHSTSVADFTTFTGTSLPASDVEIGTLALGQYQITGVAGTYDTVYGSAANETTVLIGAAVREAVVGGGGSSPNRLLLGVGDAR